DLFHDVVDAILAEDLGEQPLGALVGADERAGRRDGVGEVDEEALDDARVDRAEIGHRLGDLLDLLIVHHAEDLRGVVLAEREDEDRRLLGTAQGTDVFTRAHGQSALRQAFWYIQERTMATASSGCFSTISPIFLMLEARTRPSTWLMSIICSSASSGWLGAAAAPSAVSAPPAMPAGAGSAASGAPL